MADDPQKNPENLDAIVEEIVSEAHLGSVKLKAEDKQFLKEHALKKPLKVLDIWALGVGVVITGAYFGWNLGLKGNGAIAMLIASLIVCLLYLTWVLTLAELSVAMPFAGGPLAYGRRAVDSSLGFIMGWSMFLECQFATIATALATGGYVAYLVGNGTPDPDVRLWVALATVAIFFVLQAWGVKEQSWVMMGMTYGAILGLIIFWIAAATHFDWDRIWKDPVMPTELGWMAVLMAIPYALWWLVIIETVALAAEEAHEPHRTIPRGLVWAQLTLIGLVVLTWLFACGTMNSQELAATVVTDEQGNVVMEDGEPKTEDVDYPLLKAINIKSNPSWLFWGFGSIAVFGMIASYHGMVFGTSRQAFALGRAGYLPAFLGKVHATRRTPTLALLTTSLITAGFVIANRFELLKNAMAVVVLLSTLPALIWYMLAMGCLFTLRKNEPGLFHTYRAPLYRILPIAVIILAGFALYVYSVIIVEVIPITVGLYALGMVYYWFWAHPRVQRSAPEELAARILP